MSALAALWCSIAHDSPMWPIHGQYACRVCGIEFTVAWSNKKTGERPKRDGLRVYEHAAAQGR